MGNGGEEQTSTPDDSTRYETFSDTVPQFADATLCTTQCARSVVACVECRKPRVLCAKQKLSRRHELSLATALSEFDYTCGSPLLAPDHPLVDKVMLRENLSCVSPIELPHYGTCDVGWQDICTHCGNEGGEIDSDYAESQ